MLSGREGHRLSDRDIRPVDLGDRQALIRKIAIIGQKIKGAAGPCGLLDLIIDSQCIGLHTVGHDQNVGIINGVAAICDANADRVDLACGDRGLDRKNDGEAVHLGVVKIKIGGVVDIEVFVDRTVDRIDRHPLQADGDRGEDSIHPNPERIVHTAVDVFQILLGREDELHRQHIAFGDELGLKNSSIKCRKARDRIQQGVAIYPGRVASRSCLSIGVGRARVVGKSRDVPRGQDHPAIRPRDAGNGAVCSGIDPGRIRIAVIGRTDDLDACAKNGLGQIGRINARVHSCNR